MPMHYRNIIRLLILFFILPSAVSANVNVINNKCLSDSLKSVLARTKAPKERINILYDIFDLAPQDSVNAAGRRLLDEALAAKDYSSALDMYRRLSSFNIARDSTMINVFMEELKKLPKTPEREATECFTYLCAMTSQARYANEDERYERITELIHRYNDMKEGKTPVNDRVVLLFTLCNYLDVSMPGEILTSYLTELDNLIRQMTYRLDGLENMFYLHAAMTYTYNDQPAQAVAADRELLKVINRLDQTAKKQGRRYRDYDRFRFSVYRRMISNSEALAPEEIERIYRRINELAAQDDVIADDNRRRPIAEAYYLMSKGRYAQAVTVIRECLDAKSSSSMRRRLLRLMVKAAQETGDNEELTKAAMEYNKILEETLRERTLQRGQEMKALYDVVDIQDRTNRAEVLDKETKLASRTSYLVFDTIIIVVLIGAGVLLLVLNRRARKLSLKLQEANDMLTTERDNLRRIQADLIETRDQARKANRHKSDFISNMSHEISTPLNALVECAHLIVDNVSSEKRHYLDRFARTVDLSAEMIRTIINDVLQISDNESVSLPIQRTTVALNTLCLAAMESTRNRAKDGVELKWANENEPTQVIFTDPNRVEQVLVNLISNGLKFTEQGYVELAYSVDLIRGTTTFTVTDTGIGIPEGKEEQIFERFEKLSNFSQGSGLGLSICRMIASQLGGQVYVDTEYPGPGSRFVFIIPSTPSESKI